MQIIQPVQVRNSFINNFKIWFEWLFVKLQCTYTILCCVVLCFLIILKWLAVGFYLFGQIVVLLTHSPCTFSILHLMYVAIKFLTLISWQQARCIKISYLIYLFNDFVCNFIWIKTCCMEYIPYLFVHY